MLYEVITKLDEIKQVADRCTVLQKGKYIDTLDVADTSKENVITSYSIHYTKLYEPFVCYIS